MQTGKAELLAKAEACVAYDIPMGLHHGSLQSENVRPTC